jgi:hypothetical protein
MKHRKHAFAVALSGLFLVALAGGCQDYVFEPVIPALMEVDNQEYVIGDVSTIDLLFVVDDSCSMGGNQDNLAQNMDTFIRLLEERNAERAAEGREPLDFQIAVASTSIYERILEINRNVSPPQETVHERTTYGAGIGHPCLDGTAYQFEGGDPYPAGQFMAAGPSGSRNAAILTSQHFLNDPADALRQFRENIRLGTCGSGQEQGMEAMRLALLQNPDFFRQGSRLAVIFLSDEEDASDETGEFAGYVAITEGASTTVIDARLHPDYQDQLTPVSYYRNFLNGLAAEREGSIVVASIVSAIGEPPNDIQPGICFDEVCADNCASPNPSIGPCWCGGVSEGARYLNLANAYTESVKDAICQTDFSETLERLVRVLDPPDCFILGSRPHDDDPSLVMVRIEREGEYIACTPPTVAGDRDVACDGTADWAYDPSNAEVCICPESQCVLDFGDTYRISVVAQSCSESNPC